MKSQEHPDKGGHIQDEHLTQTFGSHNGRYAHDNCWLFIGKELLFGEKTTFHFLKTILVYILVGQIVGI